MTDQLIPMLAAAAPSLPIDWLRDRRWFSSKGREVQAIELLDWGALPIETPGIIAIMRVSYASGRPEQYFLPLIASVEVQPEGVRTPPALTLQDGELTWYTHDAFQFAAFQRLLIERMIGDLPLTLNGGLIEFAPQPALQQSPPPLREIKLVTAEQSNSSIIYDRQAILKVFRRVVAGLNPDVEVSSFLTRVGFQHTPALLGSMSYINGQAITHSLGLLQAFVPNEGDAWELTLRQLAQFLAAAQNSGAGDHDLAATTQRMAADQLDQIKQLGSLTGQTHVALASDPHDPDFAPRPLTADQVSQWQAAIRDQSESVLSDLLDQRDRLAPEQQRAVDQLLQSRDRINARIDQLAPLGTAGVVTTRFHGDYHLGQVLNSEQGFLILDFEGEPLRSLEERRAHGSPLKDVAGMLRSLSYAASSALRSSDPAAQLQLMPWADAWEAAARAAFFQGYTAATTNAPFIPQSPDLRDTAIAVFELEKALYELNYELNNRPDWLPIPLRGIQRVV